MIRATVLRALVLTAAFAAALTPVTCLGEDTDPSPPKVTKAPKLPAKATKKLPPDLRRKHDAVCRIDSALHAATAPGQRWSDILEVGIQVYEETGFRDEWRHHHQGGPMGYEGRDYKATPSETRRVVENQAVGWNPSITGTKSEDTILSSGEVLTSMRNWPTCGGRPDLLCRG